ncbi:major capsid protein [Capybara microvirus Cap1_SP_92]|nr:major capsid protein [Capybara microvirus Cap1_SP_92]
MAIENSFLYNYVETDSEQYNTFDLSFSNKFSAGLGTLYPISIQEMIPGDKIDITHNHFIRTQPLVSPVLQNLNVEVLSFAVPCRVASTYFREQISNGDGKILSVNQSTYVPPKFAYTYISDILGFLSVFGMLQYVGDVSVKSKSRIFKDVLDFFDFVGIPLDKWIYPSGKSSWVYSYSELKSILISEGWTADDVADLYGHNYSYDFYFLPLDDVSGSAVGGAPYHLLEYFFYRRVDGSMMFYDHLSELLDENPQIKPAFRSITVNGRLYYAPVMNDNSKYIGLHNSVVELNKSTYVNQNYEQEISILPFQALYKVYSDWFRDQQFIPEYDYLYSLTGHLLAFDKSSDGMFDYNRFLNLCTLHQSAYKKDYFQASLPRPQAMGEVFVPFTYTGNVLDRAYLEGSDSKYKSLTYSPANASVGAVSPNFLPPSSHISYVPASAGLELTVNNIRSAFALQSYLETLNRAGTRYVETIYAMYGVTVPDAVVNRSLYLSHSYDVLKISDVESNSVTLLQDGTINTPLGQLAGKGVTSQMGQNTKFEFNEFGFVIHFLRIVPETAYFQGVRRMFFRTDPLDFYNSKFANLGEQPVYTNEIYYNGEVNSEHVFGYMPRYSEYRANQNEVHGELKRSMSKWIAVRKFASAPTLSVPFLEVGKDDIKDIFAVTDSKYDPFICDFYFDIKKSSKMPIFDVPAVLSH